jgi:hypothetical protein
MASAHWSDHEERADRWMAHDPDLVAALHEGDSYVARCLNATGPTTTTPAALLAPALP